MRREAIGHCSYYCMGKKRRFSFLSSKIVSLCKTTHVLKNLEGAIDSGPVRSPGFWHLRLALPQRVG